MKHRRRMLPAFAALLFFNFQAAALLNFNNAAQRRTQTRRATQSAASGLKLVPNRVALSNGNSFTLNLPEGLALSVAAEGLKRVRFMALSPDARIFVTDMYNLTDNTRGAVYILEGFDPTA